MMIRIQESINLHNARKRISNLEAGNPKNTKIYNLQAIGMLIYPESSYQAINVSMNKIKTGQTAKVTVDWIEIICNALKIDPNFLFGFKSKHDKDYKRLVQQNVIE